MYVGALRNSFPNNLSLNDENFSGMLGLVLVQIHLIPEHVKTPNSYPTYSNANFLPFLCNTLSIQAFFHKIYLNAQKINQLDFISKLFDFTFNFSTLNKPRLKIFHLLREITIIESNTFSGSLKSNFRVNEVLFLIFQKFRFLKIICSLLLDFFKEPKLAYENKEILTMFSEKQVTFFYKIITKINISEKNYGEKKFKNNFHGNKIPKNLFFLKMKQIKMVSFQKFLSTSIINGILTNKLIYDKFSFYFHQKNIWNRLKINGKIKNLIKFIKKEIFYCSTNIFHKNLRKNIQLKYFKEIRSLFLKTYKNSFFSGYKFDVLQKFSYFLEGFKLNSFRGVFFQKNLHDFPKTLLLDILINFDPSNQKNPEVLIFKKKILKKSLNYLIKGLILSNSLKKFVGFMWYLSSFSLLKRAMENSWRIQLTKRNTVFFELNLNKSMKFNSEILVCFTTFQKKFCQQASDEFSINFQNRYKILKKSPNLFILVENFFLNFQMNLGMKSIIFAKQINRIIGIGNFYLLTILRVKKIFSDGYKFKLEIFQKKKKLTDVFGKKIRILFKNLRNSKNFLEISNLF